MKSTMLTVNNTNEPPQQPWPSGISIGTEFREPIAFEFVVPDGNYELSMTLEEEFGDCRIEVAPRRLLFIGDRKTGGALKTLHKTVNVRDGHLLVACYGDGKFNSPEIKLVADATTVFLAGDSTVSDQVNLPWTCWGQMLPSFFRAGIAISNHARGGKAARSFIWEKWLDRILSVMRPGDYLLFQFGHNDQKAGAAFVEPFTTYKEALRAFISSVRQKNGIPVVVTPVHRAFFDVHGRLENTLGEYPAAARELAEQEGVECVDLSARSEEWLNILGPEKAKLAFVTAPPGRWPKYPNGIKSKSHNTAYGAYELAKCIVNEIKCKQLSLAKFLEDQDSTLNFEPRVIGPWEALIR